MEIDRSLELLFIGLQIEPVEEKTERLSAWSEADWQAALQQAQRLGLTSLLAWRCKQLPTSSQPPAGVRAALEAALRQAALQNMQFFHHLSAVLQRLAEVNIPVIPLKGAYLAEKVYPNLAARPMGDLDLLVPKAELERAYEEIRRLGYRPAMLFHPDREVKGSHHLPPLVGPDRLSIEVHWTLIPPYLPHPIDLEGLWQRAQPITLSGQPALALSTPDLLLSLILHLCQHQFKFGLRTLLDLAEVLQQRPAEIDWPALLQAAQQARAEHGLVLSLQMAHSLLQAPLPPDSQTRWQPASFSPQLVELATRRLFGLAPPPPVHPFLIGLRGARQTRLRLRPILESIFWRRDYLAQRYKVPANSWRIYLYYPRRWFDLFWNYGGPALRVLLGKPEIATAAQQDNLLDDWLVTSE